MYASSIGNIRRIFLNNEMFSFLGWDPFNSAFNILESLQTSKRGEMSRYTIVCLVIFGYFFSSSIVQNKCVSKLFTFMFGLYIPVITILFNKKKSWTTSCVKELTGIWNKLIIDEHVMWFMFLLSSLLSNIVENNSTARKMHSDSVVVVEMIFIKNNYM